MQGDSSRNVKAKEVCLKHKSLGINEYYGLDIRFVDGDYIYFISNIDLHKSRWYFHKVKIKDNVFKFDGLKFHLSDFIG